ncbi:hypothetical protein [Marinobacter sp. ST-43]|uniref:hypothetical protein n=1 Tax=Marinobacter sp. ST-43 TaxID=3050453 RepID=UPI0026E0B55E|nr:hypothetical protein [Marinobacter sp. ST-43]
MLIGCPYCEKNWDEMELSRASEVTETERQLWEEMGSDFSDPDELRFRDICLAISVAMRPFDVIHEPVKHCPNLSGHSDFVSRAYLLLDSSDLNASWRKQCHQRRQAVRFLGTNFVEARATCSALTWSETGEAPKRKLGSRLRHPV